MFRWTVSDVKVVSSVLEYALEYALDDLHGDTLTPEDQTQKEVVERVVAELKAAIAYDQKIRGDTP